MLPFFLVFIVLALAYMIYNMRPLTDQEVSQLAANRRQRQIRSHYNFNTWEYSVDLQFKKRMRPDGKFYPMDESLYNFPAVAAGLLKYKKHEWIIVAFEKDGRVSLLWVNKGMDRTSVNLYLPIEQIVEIAKERGYGSILIFHNHPNSDPGRYSCRIASPQDIKTAEIFAQALNENGINLVEFVCERGRHHEYFLAPADSFFPVEGFLKDINRENTGRYSLKNFSLHMEKALQII